MGLVWSRWDRTRMSSSDWVDGLRRSAKLCRIKTVRRFPLAATVLVGSWFCSLCSAILMMSIMILFLVPALLQGVTCQSRWSENGTESRRRECCAGQQAMHFSPRNNDSPCNVLMVTRMAWPRKEDHFPLQTGGFSLAC